MFPQWSPYLPFEGKRGVAPFSLVEESSTRRSEKTWDPSLLRRGT